jgi:hypothetical protein
LPSCEYERILQGIITMGSLMKLASAKTIDPSAVFITRWKASGAGERANCQLFLSELCDLIDVARPNPTRNDDRLNLYVFERTVIFPRAYGAVSTGRIDLYKRGCFVLEAKQGSDHSPAAAPPTTRTRRGMAVRGGAYWERTMKEARMQAQTYARALPPWEGWPPFLIVVDVGHSIELFADFSLSGTRYSHFPEPSNSRILLDDLTRPEIRARLAKVWTTPFDLDPARAPEREAAPLPRLLAKPRAKRGMAPEAVSRQA